MAVTVGIDIGGSATKIIGFRNDKIDTQPLMIRASDPLTSLFGAFGRFITINNLKIHDVSRVMITGLGAAHLKEPIYGIPSARVDEFLSVGLGGLYLSNLPKALVVSMGTGTAFISADDGTAVHMGGSGVGGGTLSGLSSKLLNTHDMDLLLSMAEKGDLSKVDLTIKDITTSKMALGEDVTVSNFGKMSDVATQGDIALGILNMCFQTIGVMSYFLARLTGNKNVVITGKLSTFAFAKSLCDIIGELYGISFIKPEHSEFATAAGAALAFIKNKDYIEIK